MRFLTDQGVDVTNRVRKKQTAYVAGTDRKARKEAEAIAKKKRSYVYDMFAYIKNKGEIKVGFGIPN